MMKARLRVPRALVVVLVSAPLVATVGASCGDDDQCIRCLPDPRLGDAGTDAVGAEPCPPCLPMDGVCPVGCIPEGYV